MFIGPFRAFLDLSESVDLSNIFIIHRDVLHIVAEHNQRDGSQSIETRDI